MKSQIFFFTKLYGEKFGEDEFGNIYYKTKPFWLKIFKRFFGKSKERRWVIYKNIIEATLVPPSWFGWLHFTSNQPLDMKPYPWAKSHLPNLSGTKDQYMYPYSIKSIPKMNISAINIWTPIK